MKLEDFIRNGEERSRMVGNVGSAVLIQPDGTVTGITSIEKLKENLTAR